MERQPRYRHLLVGLSSDDLPLRRMHRETRGYVGLKLSGISRGISLCNRDGFLRYSSMGFLFSRVLMLIILTLPVVSNAQQHIRLKPVAKSSPYPNLYRPGDLYQLDIYPDL